MNRRILIALLALALSVPPLLAQMPPGKWWQRPDVVSDLGLTQEQQQKLDAIFRSSADDLIDLRGDVEKQNVALRGELEQTQLNRANIQKIAVRLNEARGRLFERELAMLVDMRGVLTNTQWTQMRTHLDARAAQGPGAGRRQGMRRQGMQQPPRPRQ